jgi:hypothetical protein
MINEWLEGARTGGNWCGVNVFVRDWLIAQRGPECWECSWSEINKTTGKVPVQVDHINGDPEDHSAVNLRLLCPNCHSLTSTFGALNKGKGRAKRYKKFIQE